MPADPAAGQKMEYLVAQLTVVRDGTRVNPIMSSMAKGLTNTDIANMALYLREGLINSFMFQNRHSGEGRNPGKLIPYWIPAYAGMTGNGIN